MAFLTLPTRLIFVATVVKALVVLPDGRHVHVIKNDILLDAVGDFIVDRVEQLAKDAIAIKGSFSMSIGSGTTVKPLALLADRSELDLSKLHIFFGNERTEGEAKGKCFNSGASVFAELDLPESNIHRVPEFAAEDAAETYEMLIREMPRDVVGLCESTGLPSAIIGSVSPWKRCRWSLCKFIP
eukprot:scaffold25787_cov64-Cyclotella_meneghiniana.AAC.7